jgi:hypothetical protein
LSLFFFLLACPYFSAQLRTLAHNQRVVASFCQCWMDGCEQNGLYGR